MPAAVLVLCIGLLAACGEDQQTTSEEESSAPTSPSTAPTTSPASPSALTAGKGAELVAGASDFGTVLFDDTGQAIYIFDVETTPRPRCYGACAEAWPPVVTEGAPQAGAKVRKSLLGTTERRNGDLQVTYGGHPLYFYAHEGKDEVKCHDVFLNGGTWYAVQPDGERAP
jgi:predicted lipoprotein with Yx(FWY)xxD motif